MSENLPIQRNEAENKLAMIQANELGVFTSVNMDTHEGRLDVYEALTDAQNLEDAEMIGKPFNLKDVIIQTVVVNDNESKEDRPTLRTILITDKGEAYAAVSEGLFNSVRNLFGLVGSPATWAAPLPVVVKRVRGRSGFFFFTLSLYRGKAEK